MTQVELEKIVSLVAQQVLSSMENGKAQDVCCEGKSKILVIGNRTKDIPEEILYNAVPFNIEDYVKNQNILRYDKVIITKLTITQMSDISLGRISDDVTCAVINALLNGVDILMIESAMPHRKFAGKGSAALYNLLESYGQTLQRFGVKLYKKKVREELPPPPPPKYKAPPVVVPPGTAKPNISCLITEAEARELIKQGGEIHLPAGTIITPSAKDIFAVAKVEVIRES